MLQVLFFDSRKERTMEEQLKIPTHVAIIMDGNGRWAKKRFMPRTVGHQQGAKRVEEICRAADKLGIRYLTVYAFSTENWMRPIEEVETLMMILRNYMTDSIKKARDNHMRVRVIGDKSRLPQDIQQSIQELEQVSASNTGLNFQIALNYGSRDEMMRAIRKMMQDYKDGKIEMVQVDEALFSSYLDTKDIPDPDLVIRTSGEQRLSNYMMWQNAYAEFYFPEILWPDFDEKALLEAVRQYTARDRRFGGVKK